MQLSVTPRRSEIESNTCSHSQGNLTWVQCRKTSGKCGIADGRVERTVFVCRNDASSLEFDMDPLKGVPSKETRLEMMPFRALGFQAGDPKVGETGFNLAFLGEPARRGSNPVRIAGQEVSEGGKKVAQAGWRNVPTNPPHSHAHDAQEQKSFWLFGRIFEL